jgi:hypothetical protein
MGLDAVELVMEVEDQFDIAIPDKAACELVSVGDLYKYILTQRNRPLARGCCTASAFYQLRRCLVERYHLDKRSIRPTTDLASLIPREQRFLEWEALQKTCSLAMPGLGWPAAAEMSLMTLYLLVIPAAIIVVSVTMLPVGWLLGVLGMVLWLVVGSSLLTRMDRWLARELPAATVGEAAKRIVGLNCDYFTSGEADDPNVVWLRVASLTAEHYGLDFERVSHETTFAEIE